MAESLFIDPSAEVEAEILRLPTWAPTIFQSLFLFGGKVDVICP
jgi:hypothetical protein